MTTPVIIAAFVALAIVMAALGGWNHHKRKERATNEDKAFSTAPYWAKLLLQKVNILIAGQRRLHQHIGSEADADERRDIIIMATTQQSIDALKAKVGPMTDAIAALTAAWDAYTAGIEEAKDDPEEIQAVVDAYEAQKEQILTLALRGTTPPPPAP